MSLRLFEFLVVALFLRGSKLMLILNICVSRGDRLIVSGRARENTECHEFIESTFDCDDICLTRKLVELY